MVYPGPEVAEQGVLLGQHSAVQLLHVLPYATCAVVLQAFSAVGAMQGAWYLATGQVLSFSEQQLVDCSWNYGNNGCQGGEMEPAIQYIAEHGGAAAEEDYQYKGQNMFCG